jgi:alpha-amylase
VRTFLVAFVLVTLVSAGCGHNANATSPTTVVQLSLTGSSTIAGVGGVDQLTAIETLQNNTQQTAANPAWSSSNTSIATVSSTGLVTAVAIGQVTITVVDANITVSGTVSVVPNFTGTWAGTTVNGAATSAVSLVLSQTGSNVGGSGVMSRTGGDSPFNYTSLVSGSVSGVTLTFNITLNVTGCLGTVNAAAALSGPTTLLLSPSGGQLSGAGNGCTVTDLTTAPGTTLTLTKQ